MYTTETRIGIPFFNTLARPFPLEHKKLMIVFMIMIMLMIVMSLVGTKLNERKAQRREDQRDL